MLEKLMHPNYKAYNYDQWRSHNLVCLHEGMKTSFINDQGSSYIRVPVGYLIMDKD